jgi:hypothetical protein
LGEGDSGSLLVAAQERLDNTKHVEFKTTLSVKGALDGDEKEVGKDR